MTPLFKKLNLAGQRSIHVLTAPASFEAELQSLPAISNARSIATPVGRHWVEPATSRCAKWL